jgi:hypothetical protein
LVGAGSAVVADKNVANKKAVTVSGYSLSGSDSANYTLVQPTALTSDISRASIMVTGLTAADKVYDAATNASLNGSAAVTALGSDSVSLTGTGSAVFMDKNVAAVKSVSVLGYSLSGADHQNYTLTQPVGLSAGISKANISVYGVKAANKTYDTNRVAALSGTAKVSALGADVVSVGGVFSALFNDKNAADNKVVTVDGYNLTGADSANYSLIQPTGLTANVGKVELLVNGVAATNKTYDASLTASLTGTAAVYALGLDSVTLGGKANAVFSDKNVAGSKQVTVTGYTLLGTDSANYTLVQPKDLSASIGKAKLLVGGITAVNKTYDSVITGSLSGTPTVIGLGSDSVSIKGKGSAVFADNSIGSNKLLKVAGYSLSGADRNNYQLMQPVGLRATILDNPASKVISRVAAFIKLPQIPSPSLALAAPAPSNLSAPTAQQSNAAVADKTQAQESGTGASSGQSEAKPQLAASSSMALGNSGSAFFMMGDGVKMPDNAVASKDE